MMLDIDECIAQVMEVYRYLPCT